MSAGGTQVVEPNQRDNFRRELRAAMRRRREQLPAQEVDRASAALDVRLRTTRDFEGFGALAGYAAIRGEISLRTHLLWRQAQGARVYLPRVESPGRMSFVQVQDMADLRPGAFGTAEPAGAPAPLHEVELFFIPGLAFDRQGHRLGYGGGYYDRALAGVKKSFGFNEVDGFASNHAIESRCRIARPILVGVCYDWQLVDEEIPAESHDIAMDVIATDRALFFVREVVRPG